MANEEHLARLREGVKGWNAWWEKEWQIRPDLSEADLSNADLRGVDLSQVDLRRAKLIEADLRGADLRWSHLTGADLSRVNLVGGNIGNAHLGKADLSKADLSKADLSGANLHATNLTRANLYGADLSGTNLHGANLSAANLSKAALHKAILVRTNLSRANLSGANLSGALISETVFLETRLTDLTGLETCQHAGPSNIDYRTLGTLRCLNPFPVTFLRGCGVAEKLIEFLPSILNQAIQHYSCFISYSHADESFAKHLHARLQQRGIRCWLDEKDSLPSYDAYDEADRGIQPWDKVLLCCSEASLKRSVWIAREIDKALRKEERLRKERENKVVALIPLNLDGYLFKSQSEEASTLKSRFAPDFTDWQHDSTKFDEGFERVVETLQAD